MRLTCLVCVRRASRDGLTRIEVAVIVVVLLVAAILIMPQQGTMRETPRGNVCRSNMRAVATAVFQYGNDNGHYPGYLNVLRREDDSPFVDPRTGEVTPVSWCVMIMPYIDRRPTFDQWRKVWTTEQAAATASATATGTAAPQSQALRFLNDQYIELFLCSSDPQQTKTGTPISFVANTGLPDRSAAVPADAEGNGGVPRDWAANGMLFDNYSEHELIKTAGPRGPMEYMDDTRVKDPHAMTILLTENIDATNYVFSSATHAADGWRACEVQTGSIWRPGAIDASTKPPTMTPPVASLQINAARGLGDGRSYDFCRPSSNHPQSVNVAYVGQNVAQLRDTISYFVFAKLMAPDDEHVQDGVDPSFRTYPLTEADIGP